MQQAKQGDMARIHYVGKLGDGRVFDTSRDEAPMEFEIGAGAILAAIDEAVVGMSPGQTKTVTIAMNDAFGPRHEQLVQKVPRESLPKDLAPAVGMRLRAQTPDGRPVELTITEVETASVTLDANHPLAGHDLTFDIELIELRPQGGGEA